MPATPTKKEKECRACKVTKRYNAFEAGAGNCRACNFAKNSDANANAQFQARGSNMWMTKPKKVEKTLLERLLGG